MNKIRKWKEKLYYIFATDFYLYLLLGPFTFKHYFFRYVYYFFLFFFFWFIILFSYSYITVWKSTKKKAKKWWSMDVVDRMQMTTMTMLGHRLAHLKEFYLSTIWVVRPLLCCTRIYILHQFVVLFLQFKHMKFSFLFLAFF